jgi:hypothetical protein
MVTSKGLNYEIIKMVTFKQWFNGEGHCRYETFSDFKWSIRDGLIVFCGLQLFVLCMVSVIWLIMSFDNGFLLNIGTALSFILGYIRFAIQWKGFN